MKAKKNNRIFFGVQLHKKLVIVNEGMCPKYDEKYIFNAGFHGELWNQNLSCVNSFSGAPV